MKFIQPIYLPIDNKILQQDHCSRYNVTYFIHVRLEGFYLFVHQNPLLWKSSCQTITSPALALTFVFKTPYIIFKNIWRARYI